MKSCAKVLGSNIPNKENIVDEQGKVNDQKKTRENKFSDSRKEKMSCLKQSMP